MTRNVHTNADARPKRRGLRFATLAASAALVTGGVLLPVSSAMAAPMPTSTVAFVHGGGAGGAGGDGGGGLVGGGGGAGGSG
ncbi:hypothetical protein, partial [Streptomyces puniciscabiei]